MPRHLLGVKLEYYGVRRADGPQASALCKVRLTPTQIVVVSGEVTQLRPHGGIRLGTTPLRFRRNNGSKIPNRPGGWELARGERQRIERLEARDVVR